MKMFFLPLLASLLITVCACAQQPGAEPSAEPEAEPEKNTDIVAIVDDELILKREVTAYAEEYYASIGLDASEYPTEEINALYSSILDKLILELVEQHKADELGFTGLSAEDAKLAEANRQLIFDERYAHFYDTMKSLLPDADESTLIERTDAAVLAYIQETGESDEYLLQMCVYDVALDNMYTELTAGVSVSEAELKAGYEQRVSQDRATYTAHPDYFASDKTTNLIYYNLEGYRYVKHILLSDEGTASEVRALAETRDFDALMAEYTEDEGSCGLMNGFAVCEGCELYTQGFADAAMALQAPGDISGVTELSDGFHIIKYVADIPAGAESFDAVREYLSEELISAKRADAYGKLLEDWKSEADIIYYYDILYS